MKKLAVGAGLAAAVLAGCSVTPALVEPPPAAPTAPAMTQSGLERAIKQVTQAIVQADGPRDPAQLAGRLTGPALASRTADYKLVSSGQVEGALIASLFPGDIQSLTVGNSPTWPRWALEVNQPPKSQPLQIFGYVQSAPRADYQLWGWVNAFPKVEIPATNKVSVGSDQLGQVAPDLLANPGEVAGQYAKLLLNPGDEALQKLFGRDQDPFMKQFVATRTATEQAFADVTGFSVGFNAAPAPEGYLALATTDAGALVMATIDLSLTVSGPREIPLTGALRVLSGKETAPVSVIQYEKATALFFLPAKTQKGATVKVLGASKSVVGAAVS